MKILIIEDEEELAQSMVKYLSSQLYMCEVAASYADSLDKIHQFSYDCILLDLMLPDGNGLNLLKVIHEEKKQEGVIIISAKNSLEDKLYGLNTGADDYLAKPFHLSELAARVFAVIRRRAFGNSNIIRHQEIKIDVLAKTVFVHEREVIFTKREFDLLLYLVVNKNKVVSKNALAEHLTGDFSDMMDDFNFLYAHIKNIKHKLTEAGSKNYLKTIYASGYKWEE
ncbi:DNA-binding response regulator, OmpR family, contains REC and winged-helix (wHTH) domain [bacterium A37T11]|nr:DNA-binding response regulator, OmpR family, contains REC and winged-helix (wHTH) domain [bacterium A37T11]